MPVGGERHVQEMLADCVEAEGERCGREWRPLRAEREGRCGFVRARRCVQGRAGMGCGGVGGRAFEDTCNWCEVGLLIDSE